MADDGSARIFGLIAVAEDQQAAVRAGLEGLAQERAGLAKDRVLLGVWAAEGLGNNHPKIDLSESRRIDYFDATKGSRTTETAPSGDIGLLPPRLLVQAAETMQKLTEELFKKVLQTLPQIQESSSKAATATVKAALAVPLTIGRKAIDSMGLPPPHWEERARAPKIGCSGLAALLPATDSGRYGWNSRYQFSASPFTGSQSGLVPKTCDPSAHSDSRCQPWCALGRLATSRAAGTHRAVAPLRPTLLRWTAPPGSLLGSRTSSKKGLRRTTSDGRLSPPKRSNDTCSIGDQGAQRLSRDRGCLRTLAPLYLLERSTSDKC